MPHQLLQVKTIHRPPCRQVDHSSEELTEEDPIIVREICPEFRLFTNKFQDFFCNNSAPLEGTCEMRTYVVENPRISPRPVNTAKFRVVLLSIFPYHSNRNRFHDEGIAFLDEFKVEKDPTHLLPISTGAGMFCIILDHIKALVTAGIGDHNSWNVWLIKLPLHPSLYGIHSWYPTR